MRDMRAFLDSTLTTLGLSLEEKKAVHELGNIKAFKKGSYLLREGETARYYYFILKGCLRSFYVTDGEERTTAFYEEGEGATPVSYVDKKPSEYYLQCLEDSILGYADSKMEAEIFRRFPHFESICRHATEKELAAKQSLFDHHHNSTPEERYARLLRERPGLFHRAPQYQIASYLGIKPETLSRIKKRMLDKP